MRNFGVCYLNDYRLLSCHYLHFFKNTVSLNGKCERDRRKTRCTANVNTFKFYDNCDCRMCVQNAAAADVRCRNTQPSIYTPMGNGNKGDSNLNWKSLKHIVLLQLKTIAVCFLGFSFLFSFVIVELPVASVCSSIRSGRFVSILEALVHDVCRFESTRHELIFKLQGVTTHTHTGTMRYSQLTRFRGLMQLFQSISSLGFVSFFRVLACLSRVSCVQFNEMQRHSHTHDYLFRRPNATGTCVRLFSVIFRRKRNIILLLTRLHFGKTDENSKCIMCARCAVRAQWWWKYEKTIRAFSFSNFVWK